MNISLYRPRTPPPFEPDFGVRSPKSRGGVSRSRLIGVSLPNSISRSGRAAKSRGGVLGLGLEGEGFLGLYGLILRRTVLIGSKCGQMVPNKTLKERINKWVQISVTMRSESIRGDVQSKLGPRTFPTSCRVETNSIGMRSLLNNHSFIYNQKGFVVPDQV